MWVASSSSSRNEQRIGHSSHRENGGVGVEGLAVPRRSQRKEWMMESRTWRGAGFLARLTTVPQAWLHRTTIFLDITVHRMSTTRMGTTRMTRGNISHEVGSRHPDPILCEWRTRNRSAVTQWDFQHAAHTFLSMPSRASRGTVPGMRRGSRLFCNLVRRSRIFLSSTAVRSVISGR